MVSTLSMFFVCLFVFLLFFSGENLTFHDFSEITESEKYHDQTT